MPKKPNDKEPLKLTPFLFTPDKESEPVNVAEEHLLKIIDETYSKNDIELKTDLNQKQINALTKAEIFAKRYNCSIMEELRNSHMILLVSKDRKGRKEFTDIAKGMQPAVDDGLPDLKKRFLGE